MFFNEKIICIFQWENLFLLISETLLSSLLDLKKKPDLNSIAIYKEEHVINNILITSIS